MYCLTHNSRLAPFCYFKFPKEPSRHAVYISFEFPPLSKAGSKLLEKF